MERTSGYAALCCGFVFLLGIILNFDEVEQVLVLSTNSRREKLLQKNVKYNNDNNDNNDNKAEVHRSAGVSDLPYYYMDNVTFDAKLYPEFAHLRLSVSPSDDHSIYVHFTYKEKGTHCKRFRVNNDKVIGSRNLNSPTSTHNELRHLERKVRNLNSRVSLGVCYWEKRGESTESAERSCAVAQSVGCFKFDDVDEVWHFFVAKMINLQPDLSYEYKLGILPHVGEDVILRDENLLPVYTLVRNNDENTIAVIGDLGREGISLVAKGMANNVFRFNSLVHLGDASYSSNRGGCYGQENNLNCEYNCPENDANCEGRLRRNDNEGRQIWETYFNLLKPITSRIPWATTNGNHDNDMIWFLKYRPPVNLTEEALKYYPNNYYRDLTRIYESTSSSALQQQALINSIGKHPYFHSYNYQGVHIVSIGTEDNFINPYEYNLNEGEIKPKYRQRFALHYGKNSPQYKWLEKDLATVDRELTPWVFLFTHRPMWHSSDHHPSCTSGGDWYGCEFRELYSALFERYRVNLVLGGHAHHYQRSKPMIQGKPVDSYAPRYIVCGTGGFELDNPFDPNGTPEWIAFRQSRWFGYCQVTIVNATYALWKHIVVEDNPFTQSTKDEAWITRGLS